MYNRYIPQPDGSFQRNRIHEKNSEQYSTKQPEIEHTQHDQNNININKTKRNIQGFLRQLLPKEFDTSDLIIVLLLLLLAGDCKEEKTNALLTLALYFIM